MKALIAALLFAGLFVVPASAEECIPAEEVVLIETAMNGATDHIVLTGDEAKRVHLELYNISAKDFEFKEATELQMFTYPSGLAQAVVMINGCAADFYLFSADLLGTLFGEGA